MREKVEATVNDLGPHVIPETVVDLSRPPKLLATSFRSMRAYGMHLRCKSAEIGAETVDSGVAVSFLPRMSIDALRRNELDNTSTEYVGWIEEIVELDYRRHCVIVLACSWVKARQGGPNPTIRRDKYGFTCVKFSEDALMRVTADSFAFPIHVQQVFYAPDVLSPDWKVVCKVVVRGRRGEREFANSGENGILSMGRDAQFPGLRALPSPVVQARLQQTHALFASTPNDAHAAQTEDVADYEEDEETRLLGDSSEDELVES
jgi:hypothetical protein